MSPMTGRTTVSESLKTILICIDSYENLCMQGLVYHSSLGEGKKFQNLMQMLLLVEKILEDTGFPKATTEKRRFHSFKSSIEGAEAGGNERDFQNLKGKVATFKIKIMFRQYASWQGSVSWMEGNNTEPFRSALELLMLMNSAMSD
jgi:hypothetical protein